MEEFDVKFNKDDHGGIHELAFSGDLILVSQWKVVEALSLLDLSACNKLKICLTDQDEFDLSFLQVLFAFIKKLGSHGVEYNIDWPDNAELMSLIERSGLSCNFNMQ